MHTKCLLWLPLCLLLFAGCRNYGLLVKRESELNCPTDIRKTVPWCAGEDAIFCCPCGPNEQFHGHKPTCWRLWQTSGAEWRDLHCEPLCTQCIDGAPVGPVKETISAPTEIITPSSILPAKPDPAHGSQNGISPNNPFRGALEPLPETEMVPMELQVPSDTQPSQSASVAESITDAIFS